MFSPSIIEMLNGWAIAIIIILVLVIGYLIYSNYHQQKPDLSVFGKQMQIPGRGNDDLASEYAEAISKLSRERDYYRNQVDQMGNPSQHTTRVDLDIDPYADPIKKHDKYTMYDHLSYPQMRPTREQLEKYQEYYEKHGVMPPFNQPTQPLHDNPVLNGMLIRQVDDNDPFENSTPMTIPLFRQKSNKTNNRYFYYILNRGHSTKLELKVPLQDVRINGTYHSNADFYGLPELYDGDIVENIQIFPNYRFQVFLYKNYNFP